MGPGQHPAPHFERFELIRLVQTLSNLNLSKLVNIFFQLLSNFANDNDVEITPNLYLTYETCMTFVVISWGVLLSI